MSTINLALPELVESQSGKATSINEGLHVLDALVNCSIVDRDLTAPPGSPVDGNVYIPKATATGAWAGKENQLAQWDVNAWKFHVPEEGWICYVRDEDSLLVYTGSAWTVLAGAGQAYDVGSFIETAPTASQVVLRHVFARSVVFAAGLAPSQGKAEVAATAQTDFDIQKAGSSVGTMRFAASGTSASFIMASQQTFAAGDILKVVAPATPDATLANITFTLTGTR
jgi:hypothetical protein